MVFIPLSSLSLSLSLSLPLLTYILYLKAAGAITIAHNSGGPSMDIINSSDIGNFIFSHAHTCTHVLTLALFTRNRVSRSDT